VNLILRDLSELVGRRVDVSVTWIVKWLDKSLFSDLVYRRLGMSAKWSVGKFVVGELVCWPLVQVPPMDPPLPTGHIQLQHE